MSCLWFSERSRLKKLRQRVTQKDTECPAVAFTGHTHIHAIYTETHTQPFEYTAGHTTVVSIVGINAYDFHMTEGIDR